MLQWGKFFRRSWYDTIPENGPGPFGREPAVHFGLYLRLDSQQLLLEKEVRSMKRDIVGTRYDDTNLKNGLASLEKQVGKLGEDDPEGPGQTRRHRPRHRNPVRPPKGPQRIQRLIDRIFGLR